MTREELEKLTKEAVMTELSQNFLDGREVLDFDEVLNVVQTVVKNCSIPDVVATEGKCCGNFTPYSKVSKWDDCQRCDCKRNEH